MARGGRPDLEIRHPYRRLDHWAAYQQAQTMIPRLLSQFARELTGRPEHEWEGGRCWMSLPTRHGEVAGFIDVLPGWIEVSVMLPGMAKLFARGRVEQTIRDFLQSNFT